MLSDFDSRHPPIGEVYSNPDGITFEVLRYEHGAPHGLTAVPSILLAAHNPTAGTVAALRHVALDHWQQFVMQHCLMRLHVDDTSGLANATAGTPKASFAGLRVPPSLRRTADTAACYLAGLFMAQRKRKA